MTIRKYLSEKFKEKIENYYNMNKQSIIKSDFDIFHFSVQQKLWESKYYSDRISNFYENDFAYYDNQGETIQTATISTGLNLNKLEIIRYCNLYIGGYFMSVMSIFDSLAHEVNTLFKFLNSKTQTKIYLYTIVNEFKKKMPNSEFYKFTSEILSNNGWWKILGKFRNAITHEGIMAKDIDISFDATVGKEILKKIHLPDNPQKRPFTYKKDYEIQSFIENLHENIPSTIESCYKKLIKDLENSKKLPIQV